VNAEDFQRATNASPAQLADLQAYRALLQEHNQRQNLLGPTALDAYWNRHAYDSWQVLAQAPDAVHWADLGAGAGLPGVVVAIFLKSTFNAEVHLVESRRKRCEFLSEVVDVLDLPAIVHKARAEDLRLSVQVVTARACAPMVELLAFAQPYLQAGAIGLFPQGVVIRRLARTLAQRRPWTTCDGEEAGPP
jgi:16S rRNA (guanine527-N7)-methyltransferase